MISTRDQEEQLFRSRSGSKRRKDWCTAAGLVTAVLTSSAAVSIPAQSVAAAEPTWETAAGDSFTRSVASGWGNADLGGAYTVTKSAGSGAASVAGGRGALSTIQPGSATISILPAVLAADVQAKGTSFVPLVDLSKLDLYSALEVRRQKDGSSYRGKLRVAAGGQLTLSISRVIAGSETFLGSYRLPSQAVAGNGYRASLQVTGTAPVSLKFKAWAVNVAEPAWQLTLDDSSAARITAAGAVAISDYLSRSSVAATVQHDDLAVLRSAAVAAAPVPLPSPSPSRGALAVGAATYAPPTGAKFVATSGNDTAAGTQTAPLRTVAAAIAKTAAGGTIVLRGGTYHEQVIVNDRAVTIQSYPGESVWFDGSVPVTGWTKVGTTWVHGGWTKSFDHSLGFRYGSNETRMLQAGYPLAGHPDQVFIDGVQLNQVASAGSVVPGTFAVDYAADKLIVGTDPTNRAVRASDLEQAIRINVPGAVLRGFGVRRYATPMPLIATIRFNKPGAIENVEIQDTATNGLSFSGTNASVNRVTILRAGQMGIHSDTADGLQIRNSIIKWNNRERFHPWITTGGIKVTKTRNAVVANNDISENYASGVWFDESSVNVKIVGNTVSQNTEAGIEAELSDNFIIANNRVSGGRSGIYLFNTGNVKIFNNAVGGQVDQGIYLSQNARRQANSSLPGHDPRYPVPDPTCPWILRNIQVMNNIVGSGPRDLVYALDKASHVDADSMNISVVGNLFSRKVTSSDGYLLAWGGPNNAIDARFSSIAQLQAKNAGWRNGETASSSTMASALQQAGSFASLAVPIPADVAAAAGVTSGIKVVGPF